MKCPICGCKMKQEIVCPYCNVTGDDVKFASNREAKKRIKANDTKEVYNSTYLPYDVDRKKLALITVVGGFFGFDLYYLGRYKGGIIQFATIFLGFISVVLSQFFGYTFLSGITEVLTLICAVYFLIWLTKIFNILLLKKAKVPVVLPDKVELKNRIIAKNEADKLKQELVEKKKSAKYDKLVRKEKIKYEKLEEKRKAKEKEKQDEK